MTAVLADTQALIWYFETSPRLSGAAKRAMDNAFQSQGPLYVSPVSLVEMIYLIEKSKILRLALDRLVQELSLPVPILVAAPLSVDVALLVATIPFSAIRDMPDRMIAATALSLGVPLVTSDRQIRASSVPTIW